MTKLTLFFFIVCFVTSSFYANQKFTLEKIITDLDQPWSLSFVTEDEIIVTEKTGKLKLINLTSKRIQPIKHNLAILVDGQGGLLDVLYYNNDVFVSYTENRGSGKSSTSVASAKFDSENMVFRTIFRAEPAIRSGYHFGSRLAIKDEQLYITAGERGKGMIAQNAQKHPGSIIRINLDGSIPKDNPGFNNQPNWLKEIYQIGLRNPQGIAVSPFDGEIYISNHGAKGGDWFGKIDKGGNYGWKVLGWGGTNYTGLPIGPKWQQGYNKAIFYWTPSIAVSAIAIYKGDTFPNWNGAALITSLKDQSLRKIEFKDTEVLSESIIFKGNIGRIRDIKVHSKSGEIYLLSDSGSLWRMF